MSLSRLRDSLSAATPAYLALTCFGFVATPAVAQNTASETASPVLGGVTVTDTAIEEGYKVDKADSPKFTQPLLDTPQTVQVINKELFNQQGATTLTEALRNSPGVGTFYAGENGNTTTGDSVYMRGFDTSNSIFVDGVRDLGSISRDVFNTEAVEVEKGPAGTDNGRTAPTGAINMVSKRPFGDDAVSGTLFIGVDGQKRATADINKAFATVPGAAFRLNLMWQDSDVAGRDHVKNKRWGLAPSLAVGLDGDTRFYVSYLYVDQDNIPDGYVPTIGIRGWEPQAGMEPLVGHPVDSENFYGSRNDYDKVEAHMATIRFEHDFSDAVKLTNTARWGQTEQNYLLTAFMSTNANVTATDSSDLSTYMMTRGNLTLKNIRNEILTDQLNLRADFATGPITHNLSVGAEITSETQTGFGQATSGPLAAANLYDPDWNTAGTISVSRTGASSRGRTNTQSVYLFDTAKMFNDMLLITGGVRVDHFKTRYENHAICGGSGRGAVSCGALPTGSLITTADLDHKDTLVNWKLGAVVKPLPSLSVYVNYALSQQPPGGSNFELSTSESSANNPNMDPQKARTYEAGVKWAVLDEALILNAAVYQTTVSNELVNDGGTYYQTGEKRVKGVELSMVGTITDAWSISAGYTHQNATVKEGSPVAVDGTNNLTYTPKDAVTSWTNYRFPFGLEIGGGVRYVSGLHRGTDGAAGTPKTTESYTVADALLGFALTDTIRLRVNAYNLFDKNYVQSINKSGYRYVPGTPRTFLFSADFRF